MLRGLLLCALLLCLSGRPAPAAEDSDLKFDPQSKSWFLLHTAPEAVSWLDARRMAREMERKGVHGRLALVKDAETHLFLEKTFELEHEAWIGLRYWCRLHKARWTDNEDLDQGRFNVWANPWYFEKTGHCGSSRGYEAGVFMPVYYLTHDNGFRWRAAGLQVGVRSFFIEFPTGEAE